MVWKFNSCGVELGHVDRVSQADSGVIPWLVG